MRATRAANPTTGDIRIAPIEFQADRSPGHSADDRDESRRRTVRSATRRGRWSGWSAIPGSRRSRRRGGWSRSATAATTWWRGSAATEVETPVTVEGMDPPGPGELPSRRDPGVQPGRMQHGRLPRHPDRQGGLPAQPARLPARPGLRDPLPRGGRPSDQPDGRRDEPDPPQAAGRGRPRRRPAARPQLEDLRVPPRLDRRGRQGRPERPRRPSGWRSCRRAGC